MARLVVSILLILLVTLYIYIIEPVGVVPVVGLLLLVFCALYVLGITITKRLRYGLLIATGTVATLAMNYILGFNIVNTVLLASFIIGVGLVYSQSHA